MKKNKTISKIFLILFLIILFITLYLILRTSYILNIDGVPFEKMFDLLPKRLNPIPFQFTFNVYSLVWLFLPLFVYAFYLAESLKPKADKKWKNIEHGSNNWQTKDDLDEFLNKCSDPIIEFSDIELSSIFKYKESINV